jgi:hypothetical protein
MAKNDVVGLLGTQKDADGTEVVKHGMFHDRQGVHEQRSKLFLDGQM